MNELELLESELLLLADCIARVKQYKDANVNSQYGLYKSNVVGELKHRLSALKQRIDLAKKIVTSDLWER